MLFLEIVANCCDVVLLFLHAFSNPKVPFNRKVCYRKFSKMIVSFPTFESIERSFLLVLQCLDYRTPLIVDTKRLILS